MIEVYLIDTASGSWLCVRLHVIGCRYADRFILTSFHFNISCDEVVMLLPI